eukprot:Nk52_evm8s559 gene=Nk52_evmTU8s559
MPPKKLEKAPGRKGVVKKASPAKKAGSTSGTKAKATAAKKAGLKRSPAKGTSKVAGKKVPRPAGAKKVVKKKTPVKKVVKKKPASLKKKKPIPPPKPKIKMTPGLAKDPNAPKRPRSAYGLFAFEHRDDVKRKFPKMGGQEVNQKLGALWKNIPDATKGEYAKKAKKLRSKYERDIIAYSQKFPHGAPPPRKLTKREQAEKLFYSKKRDPNAPAPARSAYILWANDLRTNLKMRNPQITFAELQRNIGERWKKTSDTEKKKYQQLADADKDRYEKQQAEYFKKYPMMKRLHNEKMKAKMARQKKKEEKVPKKMKKDPNAPKPPPRSGYIMWALMERPKLKEKFPSLNFIDVTKKLAEMWQSLTQKKRESYDKEVIRQKKIYETEYKLYMSGLSEEVKQEMAAQKKAIMKYKKKQRRLKKDPNAPTKPRSAYQMWSEVERKALRSRRPDLAFGDVSKIIGERWRELNPNEKSKWAKQYEKAQAEYRKALAEYTRAKAMATETPGFALVN